MVVYKQQNIFSNQTKVPGNKTVYWCNVFEIPRMEKKHHVVKVFASVV